MAIRWEGGKCGYFACGYLEFNGTRSVWSADLNLDMVALSVSAADLGDKPMLRPVADTVLIATVCCNTVADILVILAILCLVSHDMR